MQCAATRGAAEQEPARHARPRNAGRRRRAGSARWEERGGGGWPPGRAALRSRRSRPRSPRRRRAEVATWTMPRTGRRSRGKRRSRTSSGVAGRKPESQPAMAAAMNTGLANAARRERARAVTRSTSAGPRGGLTPSSPGYGGANGRPRRIDQTSPAERERGLSPDADQEDAAAVHRRGHPRRRHLRPDRRGRGGDRRGDLDRLRAGGGDRRVHGRLLRRARLEVPAGRRRGALHPQGVQDAAADVRRRLRRHVLGPGVGRRAGDARSAATT